jgi:hypothetical protein
MIVIINRNAIFGTLDAVITKNEELHDLIIQYLKLGRARKLLDTETTLMYKLEEFEDDGGTCAGALRECAGSGA